MEEKSYLFNCHDYHDSCIDLLKNKFIVMIQYSLKLYAFYHTIPMIIGKKLKFFEKENILKLIKRIIKSAENYQKNLTKMARAGFNYSISSKILENS